MPKFFRLTEEVIDKVFSLDLTFAEMRVWMYLSIVDPWGSKYEKVSSLKIMEKCRVSKATLYRTMAKLQELELFDFQDDGLSIRKLDVVTSLMDETNFSSMRQESHPRDESFTGETKSSPMRQESQPCENEPPKPVPSKDFESPKINKINQIKNKKDTTESDRPKKASKPVEQSEAKRQLEADRSQQSRGSVIEIFEKYKEQLNKYGVYLLTYQNEMLQLNPKMEPVIQEAGCLPSNKVEPAIKAFIRWIREAKDVKEPYRAFFKAIKEAWEEL